MPDTFTFEEVTAQFVDEGFALEAAEAAADLLAGLTVTEVNLVLDVLKAVTEDA